MVEGKDLQEYCKLPDTGISHWCLLFLSQHPKSLSLCLRLCPEQTSDPPMSLALWSDSLLFATKEPVSSERNTKHKRFDNRRQIYRTNERLEKRYWEISVSLDRTGPKIREVKQMILWCIVRGKLEIPLQTVLKATPENWKCKQTKW